MDPLMLLIMFAILMVPMLLMSSRQRKLQREREELVRQLTIGDEVRTHSGFYGLITDLYDDVVILETEDGSQTKWARNAIAMKAESTEVDEDAAPETEEAVVDSVENKEVRGVTE